MAINRLNISSQDIRYQYDVAIEIVQVPPISGAYMDTPVNPGKVVGWYDSGVDAVRLFVADATGYRFFRV